MPSWANVMLTTRRTYLAWHRRYPRPTVIEPSKEHKGTVIMLHGLGDTAAGWTDVGYMFKGDLPQIKFIFPTAPMVSPGASGTSM